MICLQSLHSVGVVTIQSFILCPICLVPFGYIITWFILLHYNNITWICLFFFSFLHYMVYVLSGLWVMLLVGGSYSTVYVPPPFYVVPMVLMLHILSFFSLFCVLISFSIVIPMFSSSNLCVFFTLG